MESAADFELMAPVPFSLVCFRAAPAGLRGDEAAVDGLNQALIDAVNSTGEIYLSHTRLRDRLTLRLAIGNIRTTESHVNRARQLLQEHTTRLLAEA